MQNSQFIVDESPNNYQLQFTTTEEVTNRLDFSNLVNDNENLVTVDVDTFPDQERIQPVFEQNGVLPHWFYSLYQDNTEIWYPFNLKESELIEKNFKGSCQSEEILIKKGLFKVFLSSRSMIPNFWTSHPRSKIRRATWYFQADRDMRLLPFSEHTCYYLEQHYQNCLSTNQWNIEFNLPSENYENIFDIYNFYGPDCFLAKQSHLTVDGQVDLVKCSLSRGLSQSILNSLPIGSVKPIKNIIFYIQNPLESLESTLALCDEFRSISEDIVAKNYIPKEFYDHTSILPIYYTSQESVDFIKDAIQNIRRCSTMYELNRPNISLKEQNFIESMLFWDKSYFNKLTNDLKSKINSVINKLKLQYNSDFNQIKIHSLSVGFASVLMDQLISGPDPFVVTNEDLPSEPDMNTAIFSQVEFHTDSSKIQLCSMIEEPKESIKPSVNTSFPFKFDKIFYIGSPLPKYSALASRKGNTANMFMNCSRILNVYNPFDENSSRLETYLCSDWKKGPVKIPRYRTGINLDIKTNLSRVSSDLSNRVYQSFESTIKSFQEFALSHIQSEKKAQEDLITPIDERKDENVPSNNNNNNNNTNLEIDEGEYYAQIHDTTFPGSTTGDRLDFVLQSSNLGKIIFGNENTEVYLKSYDLALFILRTTKDCQSLGFILNKLALNH